MDEKIKEEAVQEAIERAKALIASMVQGGIAGEVGPQIFLVGETLLNGEETDKPILILVTSTLAFDNPSSIHAKNQVVGAARALAVRTSAFAAVTTAEVWQSRRFGDDAEFQRAALPPSMEDWPEHLRQEVAMVMVETEASVQMHTAAIQRDAEGKATLEPWVAVPLRTATGRMTHIIPSNLSD